MFKSKTLQEVAAETFLEAVELVEKQDVKLTDFVGCFVVMFDWQGAKYQISITKMENQENKTTRKTMKRR